MDIALVLAVSIAVFPVWLLLIVYTNVKLFRRNR